MNEALYFEKIKLLFSCKGKNQANASSELDETLKKIENIPNIFNKKRLEVTYFVEQIILDVNQLLNLLSKIDSEQVAKKENQPEQQEDFSNISSKFKSVLPIRTKHIIPFLKLINMLLKLNEYTDLFSPVIIHSLLHVTLVISEQEEIRTKENSPFFLSMLTELLSRIQPTSGLNIEIKQTSRLYPLLELRQTKIS